MRVGLITTHETNIGDDFIRIGLVGALRSALGAKCELEVRSIDKTVPFTALPHHHPARLLERMPRGLERIYGLSLKADKLLFRHSIFDDCAMVVQCGAPILWKDVGKRQWLKVLWNGFLERVAQSGRPVMNLAGGSCFAWQGHKALELDAADLAFAANIGKIAQKTSVRDTLSHRIFKDAGHDIEVIPCSALLAGQTMHGVPAPDTGDLVLINYMAGGGHYDFGQQIDATAWRAIVIDLVKRLAKRHKVAFICHNQSEKESALALGTDVTVYLPSSHAEYFELAARGKAGIFNRMHASVGFGGVGIPSIAIGNDTRLLMVEQCGLPIRFTPEATADELESGVERLIVERGSERERLLALRQKTWGRYVALFRDFV